MRTFCAWCLERLRNTGILPVGQLGVLPGWRKKRAGSPRRIRPVADKMPASPTAKMAMLRAQVDLLVGLANDHVL
jgi:hypothetical protein